MHIVWKKKKPSKLCSTYSHVEKRFFVTPLTLGLGPLGLRLYSEAITPSNFTYVQLLFYSRDTEQKSGMMAITYNSVCMQIMEC